MTLGSSEAFLQSYQISPHNHNAHKIPDDIDLEGGTLISVEEFEEIDPIDSCKVFVTRYNVQSADGTEESTFTKKRKIRVNCTESVQRIEYSRGKESKFEEETLVYNPIEALNGRQHPNDLRLIQSYGNKDNLSQVFLKTQDQLMQMIQQKKDNYVDTFPELFANLRSQPAILGDNPSTYQEVVVNPDGSTTVRTKSSKAFSSHYTRQETYLNGVRQDTKCKFRAFMEYAGPEGGFKIKVKDNPDDDLSEDEGETDSLSLISRLSRSCLSDVHDTQSEVSDDRSALVVHDRNVPTIRKDPLKRYEKAWHAVNELVESENRYVQKLFLLDRFREEMEKEKLLDKRQMGLLFANTASLYRFHNDHLLPQLMDRRREWGNTRKISDVIKKQGPFLKMYSEYTNNYKNATSVFEEAMRRKRKFEFIVRKLEICLLYYTLFKKLPECENMSLVSHLICPVQRVMRYQLLLKEYQKYLEHSDPDYEDTEQALELVVGAASHANEMMRKLDRYRNVLEVQEMLGGSISLVSPSRELLKRSKLSKISSSTGKCEERLLYVFNDLILLTSERTIGLGSKLKLRAVFDPIYTQICEGDNLEREHSFYLRGADHAGGPSRCVELFCNTHNDKSSLIDTIWTVISDSHQRKNSFKLTAIPPNIANMTEDKKSCARCDEEFPWYARTGVQCCQCHRKYCKRCFNNNGKKSRICDACGSVNEENDNNNHNVPGRQNVLDIPADTYDIIKASNVKLKSSSGKILERYFVLRKNFCLYSYNNKKDSCALSMLPISGCEVSPGNETRTLLIKHLRRTYTVLLENDTDHTEWMAALILSANAMIPGVEN
ncbi:unnamed protein product [Bursaphelenchus okinawaensis]|uniref:Uncharacterized protein n=1 Tax=Bursaphelenchus okinawaensis TaxID=465554 RepID=A0A811KW33_9BILA|nr:unnamed protein product [Bursaphelenchus okinawaensis]CAG9113146.1 unnamed protein product [Bursaphelenchus okinawaensis]